MSATRYRFAEFVLDTRNRLLCRDQQTLALNARYFDALALLVREHGRLVGKQRFFEQVWAGSVVTDAALTQCIKEIRRQLGDDAANPSFVRTVSGHGYCFVAEVTELDAVDSDSITANQADSPTRHIPPPAAKAPDLNDGSEAPLAIEQAQRPLPHWLADTTAAIAGGAVAGLLGGLLYGSLLAVSPVAHGLGGLSILLVVTAMSLTVGMAGALGVGLGLAVGMRLGGAVGSLAGATLGGLLVGGTSNLLGADTFSLLVGQAPSGLTGGLEGAVIGFVLAAGLLLGGGMQSAQARRPALYAALTTGIAGMLIYLAGGSLMAGSLAQVASAFDQSRLDLSPLGQLVGDPALGRWARAALGLLEGAVFGGCVVGAQVWSRQRAAPIFASVP